MYGIQDKINQILRGAETIRKNQSMKPLQPVNSTTTFFAGKEPQTLDNEVERLKEMVMDAAKRGDELAKHWKERAEKAEAIIKQLHHYAGIIEENYAGIIEEKLNSNLK